MRRAVFSALPPSSRPAAVSSTRLAGFPTNGSTFGILSTGNARLADDPNDSPSSGSESRGPSIRGARDVVIMRVDLRVPSGANCLSFDFRFLSEEYPEFVGDLFNDAFIAELGRSTWTAGTKDSPEITAPSNFARDVQGNPIRVNRVGDTDDDRRPRQGHDLRRGDPPAARVDADPAGQPAPVPVDLRPGRPHLRLRGLRRQPPDEPGVEVPDGVRAAST